MTQQDIEQKALEVDFCTICLKRRDSCYQCDRSALIESLRQQIAALEQRIAEKDAEIERLSSRRLYKKQNDEIERLEGVSKYNTKLIDQLQSRVKEFEAFVLSNVYVFNYSIRKTIGGRYIDSSTSDMWIAWKKGVESQRQQIAELEKGKKFAEMQWAENRKLHAQIAEKDEQIRVARAEIERKRIAIAGMVEVDSVQLQEIEQLKSRVKELEDAIKEHREDITECGEIGGSDIILWYVINHPGETQ